MAGEIFIAKETTSQEIKTAVEDVQTDVTGVKTNVDGLKNTDVPNIDALVDAVLARIGTVEDTGDTVLGRLKTLMSGGNGGWSDFKVTTYNESGKNWSVSYTTSYPAIILSSVNVTNDSYAPELSVGQMWEETGFAISFVPKGTTISKKAGSSNRTMDVSIIEFI